ncbi:MAG: hypothetical protein K9N47_15250 [Prosthecobacter sp.]|uniref:hypothetical protein n=1 Tax=Prosthecobacter sp. TaxID=1965333 RepID=UPI0025FA5E57|nr:hypothetical protein [Prosthecobacter sp.]MCF7787485.1 hypothetical protein [Prosthecobacter sp.]
MKRKIMRSAGSRGCSMTMNSCAVLTKTVFRSKSEDSKAKRKFHFRLADLPQQASLECIGNRRTSVAAAFERLVVC